MTGNCDIMSLYDAEKNSFLKRTKDLLPRIVTYDDAFALCLIEKCNPKKYYCFLTKYGFYDKMTHYRGDFIKKLSWEDYFKISNRLKLLNIKFNLKKIIYDSNRNK